MTQHKLFGFTHVDQTADASYFIRFLDAACASFSFQEYKRQMATLLEIQPGHRLLDVGCGTGDDARLLATFVSPSGEVIGIDGSQAMIDEARRRDSASLPVRFDVGDAHHLTFADSWFDGVRCDRTLMHLENPQKALDEMARVTKPGGRLVVYEVDFGAITIDVPDKAVARKIIECWCDSVRDGWRGRRLPNMYRQAGLTNVQVAPAVLVLDYELGTALIGANTAERARSIGLITESEAEEWVKSLQKQRDSGCFFCTLTGFMAVGRKE